MILDRFHMIAIHMMLNGLRIIALENSDSWRLIIGATKS